MTRLLLPLKNHHFSENSPAEKSFTCIEKGEKIQQLRKNIFPDSDKYFVPDCFMNQYQQMIELLPRVIQNLHRYDQLDTWIKFNQLVINEQFP